MKLLARAHKGAGFTLLEVLIALLIFSIGLLGLASLQIVATKSNAFSNAMTVGITLTQDKTEELGNLAYDDGDLSTGSHTDSQNPITALGNIGFNRTWTVAEDATNQLKTITVTVKWPDPDETHTVAFTTVKTP